MQGGAFLTFLLSGTSLAFLLYDGHRSGYVRTWLGRVSQLGEEPKWSYLTLGSIKRVPVFNGRRHRLVYYWFWAIKRFDWNYYFKPTLLSLATACKAPSISFMPLLPINPVSGAISLRRARRDSRDTFRCPSGGKSGVVSLPITCSPRQAEWSRERSLGGPHWKTNYPSVLCMKPCGTL